MLICKYCRRPVRNNDLNREHWCSAMHRLLILNGIQPEDYHRDCFIEVLLGHKSLPHQPSETAHYESLLTTR